MLETPSVALQKLARAYGVQLEYVGMDGRITPAPASSLRSVLGALGASIGSEADVEAALSARQMEAWHRRVEPVILAWDGLCPAIEVRLPAELAKSDVACRLSTEDGDLRDWSARPIPSGDHETPEGFALKLIDLPSSISTGYHQLTLEFVDGQARRCMVISAPTRAYEAPKLSRDRTWGVFCPLYALRRGDTWGAGDFSDLGALIEWTAGLGGGIVATLPMLASNFDGPSPIISPYSPTSRVFWNEFYLDLDRIPELARSDAARTLLDSEETQSLIESLRASDLVDYGREMRLKRQVLELLSEEADRADDSRSEAFESFVARNPEVVTYARFQAAGEQLGRDWRNWPTTVDLTRINPEAIRYHLYVQWQADEQLRALSEQARERRMAWYLDFPIGVDFNSYDVWAHQGSFATGASVGCPPDPVFTKGQNWGFPPLHPDRHRESGYACLIASIRAHLQYANALRIDHVMGLHRLFWIPQGAEAKDGAFVSTPSEEIYAILSVESHRHQAWLVGEDLGTVPPEVDGAMKRHNVRGMYVVQYEVRPDLDVPLREAPEATIASVNTHDMPPFAAFWSGLDLIDRLDLGLLTVEGLEEEQQGREQRRLAIVRFLRAENLLAEDKDDTLTVLQALWHWLASSPSSILLLNLEDLWLETNSQNTPNTYTERPNWLRKHRRSFDEFTTEVDLLEVFRQIDRLRT